MKGLPVLALIFIAVSCAPPYKALVPQYRVSPAETQPDYSRLLYWAAHPDKKDPSDSVPLPLKQETQDTLADVFFVHPTTYTGTRKGWTASISDAELNAKTDYSSILYQASVFNRNCRIYAPRYRQVHLSAFFAPPAEVLGAFDTAYADVRRAFLYYLEHEHRNRPLIIAGHSQGALMTLRLLREFVDGKPLQQQLVAAYIIGWPAAVNSFKEIPVCTTATQNHCLCSWRTLRENYLPSYMQKDSTPAYVTNPLSWDTTTAYVGREKNKGSILRDFNQLVPHTTDARIHGSVLWVSRPKFPGSAFFITRNYHIGDINLYYMNLRDNITDRIRSWYAARP